MVDLYSPKIACFLFFSPINGGEQIKNERIIVQKYINFELCHSMMLDKNKNTITKFRGI